MSPIMMKTIMLSESNDSYVSYVSLHNGNNEMGIINLFLHRTALTCLLRRAGIQAIREISSWLKASITVKHYCVAGKRNIFLAITARDNRVPCE